MLKLPVPGGMVNVTGVPILALMATCCTCSPGSALVTIGSWQAAGAPGSGAVDAPVITTGAWLQVTPAVEMHRPWFVKHVSPAAHAVGAARARHPFASAVHVCCCVADTHCEIPAVEHAFTQGAQALVVALQKLPNAQGAAADRVRHPFTSAVHVCTWVPEHCVAPTLEHLLQSSSPPQPSVLAIATASERPSSRPIGQPPVLPLTHRGDGRRNISLRRAAAIRSCHVGARIGTSAGAIDSIANLRARS